MPALADSFHTASCKCIGRPAIHGRPNMLTCWCAVKNLLSLSLLYARLHMWHVQTLVTGELIPREAPPCVVRVCWFVFCVIHVRTCRISSEHFKLFVCFSTYLLCFSAVATWWYVCSQVLPSVRVLRMHLSNCCFSQLCTWDTLFNCQWSSNVWLCHFRSTCIYKRKWCSIIKTLVGHSTVFRLLWTLQ